MLLYIHTECSEFSMNTEDRKSRNNPQTCFEANFYLHLQQTFCKGPVKRGQIDLFPPPCFFLSLLLGLFILLPTNANTKESHKIKRKVKRKGDCKEMTNGKRSTCGVRETHVRPLVRMTVVRAEVTVLTSCLVHGTEDFLLNEVS